MRRQIRRKYEAFGSFLAGSGDMLPPPPESMLTQPPPPAQTALQGHSAASSQGEFAASSAAGSISAGRARAVNFALAEAGPSSSVSGGKARPKLSISLDGGSPPDDVLGGPASPKRGAPTPLSCGSRGSGAPSPGKLGWGADRPAAAQQLLQAPAAAGPRSSQQSGSKPAGLLAGAKSKAQAGDHVAARRGASQIATRHSSTGSIAAAHASTAGQHQQHALVHVDTHASSCGAACPAAAVHSSSGSGATGSSSAGSSLRLRQQVWQEVQALRAAGAQASLPGCVASALAAARHSAAELSMSGSWGIRRHGSASYWGPGSTPPRPGSPSLLPILPTHSRPGSPQSQGHGVHPGGGTTVGDAGSAATGHQGSSGSGGSSSSSVFKWGSGFSLLSSTGSSQGLPAGPQRSSAAAAGLAGSGQVTAGRPVRASYGVEKAVCFLTPRTQAAQQAKQGQSAPPSGAHATAMQSAALPGHQGVNRPHDPPASHSITCRPASSSGGSEGDASQQQQQQQLSEEQHQMLVQSACKALGSTAAAAAFVSGLPQDQQAVNFSASGMWCAPLSSYHAGISDSSSSTTITCSLLNLCGCIQLSTQVQPSWALLPQLGHAQVQSSQVFASHDAMPVSLLRPLQALCSFHPCMASTSCRP